MPADYLIGRDSDESQRLVRQNEMWTKTIGYQIHPSIPMGSPNPRVADIGCGTGTWLIALAHHIDDPSWQFDGFDISGDQFPDQSSESAAATAKFLGLATTNGHTGSKSPKLLPGNVGFHVHDMRQAFPPEYHGQYDLVHARLLQAGTDKDEWPDIVKNVRTLLKPEGWLQWEEIDMSPRVGVLRNGTGPCTAPFLEKGLRYLNETTFHRSEKVICALLNAYYEASMKDVQTDVASSDRLPEMRATATQLEMHVMRNIGKKRLQDGVEGSWTLEQLDEVYNGLQSEIEQGAYINFYIHCIIGRL